MHLLLSRPCVQETSSLDLDVEAVFLSLSFIDASVDTLDDFDVSSLGTRFQISTRTPLLYRFLTLTPHTRILLMDVLSLECWSSSPRTYELIGHIPSQERWIFSVVKVILSGKAKLPPSCSSSMSTIPASPFNPIKPLVIDARPRQAWFSVSSMEPWKILNSAMKKG